MFGWGRRLLDLTNQMITSHELNGGEHQTNKHVIGYISGVLYVSFHIIYKQKMMCPV